MNPTQGIIAVAIVALLFYSAVAWRFNKDGHACTAKGGTFLPMEGKCVTGIVILK